MDLHGARSVREAQLRAVQDAELPEQRRVPIVQNAEKPAEADVGSTMAQQGGRWQTPEVPARRATISLDETTDGGCGQNGQNTGRQRQRREGRGWMWDVGNRSLELPRTGKSSLKNLDGCWLP